MSARLAPDAVCWRPSVSCLRATVAVQQDVGGGTDVVEGVTKSVPTRTAVCSWCCRRLGPAPYDLSLRCVVSPQNMRRSLLQRHSRSPERLSLSLWQCSVHTPPCGLRRLCTAAAVSSRFNAADVARSCSSVDVTPRIRRSLTRRIIARHQSVDDGRSLRWRRSRYLVGVVQMLPAVALHGSVRTCFMCIVDWRTMSRAGGRARSRRDAQSHEFVTGSSCLSWRNVASPSTNGGSIGPSVDLQIIQCLRNFRLGVQIYCSFVIRAAKACVLLDANKVNVNKLLSSRSKILWFHFEFQLK